MKSVDDFHEILVHLSGYLAGLGQKCWCGLLSALKLTHDHLYWTQTQDVTHYMVYHEKYMHQKVPEG